MKTEFVVAISVICGVAFLFTVLKLIYFSVQKKLEHHIQENFDKEKIIGATTKANFFGERSKGGKQARGNGALVLTKDEVYFIRAVPFKEYVIPLQSIIEVSLPNSFNGKSIASKLLSVQYKTDSKPDAMAWAVKNPESWKKALEKLIADT